MKTLSIVVITILSLAITVLLVACNGNDAASSIVDAIKFPSNVCDDGYYKDDNNNCARNQYVCTNGKPLVATASDWPAQHGAVEKCGSCDSGYKLNLDDNSCVPTVYTCENGTPLTDNPIGNEDVAQCASCFTRFRLDSGSCVPTRYTCSSGTPAAGSPDGHEDVPQCSNCADYYREVNGTCVATVYICANGTPASSSPASDEHPTKNDNVNKCAHCHSGYKPNGDSCEATQYTCQNGTSATGSPAGNADVPKCASCHSGYKPNGDSCEATRYTCQNGNPATGSPPGNEDVPKCGGCHSGYIENDSGLCVTAYDYVCTNGTPIGGHTPLPNHTNCERCEDYYLLKDNNCNTPTAYVCANGFPVSGTPRSSEESITDANITKCNDCRIGYHKRGDSCINDIPYTIAVTAVSDTSIDTNITIDFVKDETPAVLLHWVLYEGTSQSKTNTQVVADATGTGGIARSATPITITGDTTQTIGVDTLNASTGYTLYVVLGQQIKSMAIDTHGTNSKYGVDFDVYCTVDSGYIPTHFSDKITGTNGVNPSEAWVPTFSELGQLPNGHRAQRECYKYAYYYQQSLPDIPPPTTTAHTNSLPSGMYYDTSKYKLVFEEDFGPNTSTNPHNTHNQFKIGTDDEQPVNLYRIFDGLQNSSDESFVIARLGHNNGNADILWPGLGPDGTEPTWVSEQYTEQEQAEIRAALQNEWAWPAFIKDGRFHAGVGRVSINHVGDRGKYYCKDNYIRRVNVNYHRTNHAVDSCECDEDTADGCIYFFGSWIAENIKFQYGFVEVDVAELMIASTGHAFYSGNEVDFIWLPSHRNHTDFETSGTLPTFLDKSNDEGYLELHKVEFQLMEHYIGYGSGKGFTGWWVAKHYYLPSDAIANAGNRVHSRFYDTFHIGNTAKDPYQKIARKLGVEWTPAGYKIWESIDGSAWIDLSTTEDFVITKSCGTDDKVNGFLQCGVSHVVASLKHSGTGRPSMRVQHPNPMYVFNHFRIYQPEGNYAEVERVYK